MNPNPLSDTIAFLFRPAAASEGRDERCGNKRETGAWHKSGFLPCRALISGSRLRAPVGPGIEFLQYLTPKEGRPLPTDTSVEDLWSEVIAMHANGSRTARILHDPDGHAVAGALVTTG